MGARECVRMRGFYKRHLLPEDARMLDLKTYLIKEHVGMLKLVDTYDIFDPESGEQVGQAREEPTTFSKFMRLLISKRLLPTTINVYGAEGGAPFIRLYRGVTFLRSKVYVYDEEDRLV